MGNRTVTGSVTLGETVSGTYTTNRLNQIVGHSSSWGGGANMLTGTLQYDQGGNLTRQRAIGTGSATSSHTEYVYDDIDRLTAVIKKNSATLANESKTEFQYDGFSRLKISKEFTWSGSVWTLVSGSEKRRVYNGMDVVQERDGNTVKVTYTRDGNIGGLLSRRTSGVSYFYHYDGSGNVVGLTDSSQNSVAEYAYDAYGNLLSSSGAQASNNSYRYSTKEHFGNIGLYNYGYRFYSPGLGDGLTEIRFQKAEAITSIILLGIILLMRLILTASKCLRLCRLGLVLLRLVLGLAQHQLCELLQKLLKLEKLPKPVRKLPTYEFREFLLGY